LAVKFEVDGLKELEKALLELPRSTSKGVARRAMRDQLKPVALMANALWPGADDDVVRIASKVNRGQRGPKEGRSIVNLFIGVPSGKTGTPHAHLIEWGTGPRFHKNGRATGAVSPAPFLQPAWDANKRRILRGLAKSLWQEIVKTQARRAKKAGR